MANDKASIFSIELGELRAFTEKAKESQKAVDDILKVLRDAAKPINEAKAAFDKVVKGEKDAEGAMDPLNKAVDFYAAKVSEALGYWQATASEIVKITNAMRGVGPMPSGERTEGRGRRGAYDEAKPPRRPQRTPDDDEEAKRRKKREEDSAKIIKEAFSPWGKLGKGFLERIGPGITPPALPGGSIGGMMQLLKASPLMGGFMLGSAALAAIVGGTMLAAEHAAGTRKVATGLKTTAADTATLKVLDTYMDATAQAQAVFTAKRDINSAERKGFQNVFGARTQEVLNKPIASALMEGAIGAVQQAEEQHVPEWQRETFYRYRHMDEAFGAENLARVEQMSPEERTAALDKIKGIDAENKANEKALKAAADLSLKTAEAQQLAWTNIVNNMGGVFEKFNLIADKLLQVLGGKLPNPGPPADVPGQANSPGPYPGGWLNPANWGYAPSSIYGPTNLNPATPSDHGDGPEAPLGGVPGPQSSLEDDKYILTPARRAAMRAKTASLGTEMFDFSFDQGTGAAHDIQTGGQVLSTLQADTKENREQTKLLKDIADSLKKYGEYEGAGGGGGRGGGGGGGQGPAGAGGSGPHSRTSSAGGPGGGGSGKWMDALANIESNNQNIVSRTDKDTHGRTLAQGGNPDEISQGYFQINQATWREFAPKAGVDIAKYPHAMLAPREVQEAVAALIPFSRFGPRTQRMMGAEFGNFDKRKTNAELSAAYGGAGGAGGAGAYTGPGGGGAAAGGLGMKGVDPRIAEIVAAASKALPPGYTVRPTEHGGKRVQGYGFHPKGMAEDFQIFGPDGKPVANRGEDASGLYTALAKNAYGYQEKFHPELTGQFQWGGQFGTVPGGSTPDLMHFDIGGRRGNISRYSREAIGAALPPDAAMAVTRAAGAPMPPRRPVSRPATPADASSGPMAMDSPLGLHNWQLASRTAFTLHNKTGADVFEQASTMAT